MQPELLYFVVNRTVGEPALFVFMAEEKTKLWLPTMVLFVGEEKRRIK